MKILYQQSLNKHISRVHIKRNDFKCPLCEHTTTDKDYLRTHIRTHETEEDSTKKWMCEICSKRFWDRCKLRNEAFNNKFKLGYVTKHNPWSHSVFINCSKLLTSEHMNIHTGEKPFQCDVCDFSCAARANLHSHKKIHRKTIPES